MTYNYTDKIQWLLAIAAHKEREKKGGGGKTQGEKEKERGTPWPYPRAIIFKKLLGDSTVDNL